MLLHHIHPVKETYIRQVLSGHCAGILTVRGHFQAPKTSKRTSCAHLVYVHCSAGILYFYKKHKN